ncbi:MOR1 isoform X1 [Olea europaea subsp. europaea]|uniref:MOR1 isoform X1 n=1 Tax=Olea europaea subsp. europaea TaxID=158383 RepID=A0A8S0QDW5_OLEEU|nr:MOR1 isoform X1 [Olea europaea subsp. europaea]
MSEDEKLLKEAKKLPWEDRLMHKNWKVRNDANIDLAAVCDSITYPKDHRLREYGPFFKKTLADSNSPVQEKALDALIAYLKAADADAGRCGKEVCDVIVAKCLTGRPKTVERAQTAFMLWVELEAVEAFLDAMEKAIKNKVSKAVVPAIDVMFQALSEFGSKIVPPKRILKMLPELFDHQDQSVRASSKGLTLELCRWIGKDPKKELEAELVNVIGTAKPTRKIRSEQGKEPEQEAVSDVVGSGPSEEPAADVPEVIDEYELVDPVDILTPLEKLGFWDGVKASKWSERKEGVSELTKLASTERIAPGDFTEICRTLKKLITDVNIAVAVEAIQATGNLASGLRTHFSGNSRFLLPVLLEKLKEKKPTLMEALTQTLQAMHKRGCLNLADIVEGIFAEYKSSFVADVKTAIKNKVPLVRSLTLNWVTFCIETSNKALILKVHKEYVPICMECFNGGTSEVRDAAFLALAALVGMRPLEKSLEKLDDVRKKKLSEMIGSSGGGQSTVTSTDMGRTRHFATRHGVVKKAAARMKKTSNEIHGHGSSSSTAAEEFGAGNIQKFTLFLVLLKFEKIRICTRYPSPSPSIIVGYYCFVILYTQGICLTYLLLVKATVQSLGRGMSCTELYKIMKEHKNPKVLSEGILWMVSAVEDFGVSYLKLKDLIDFCKDIGLQSSAAATRNSTIKLIGVLHKFIGPDIKAFLTDVKPALLSALDAEYEKNTFEGTSAVPKKTVKLSDSASSLAAGGLDGLPREDICEKVTPTLLKGLEFSDWKIRLESIETVNKIMEEANKRIQPTGTTIL